MNINGLNHDNIKLAFPTMFFKPKQIQKPLFREFMALKYFILTTNNIE